MKFITGLFVCLIASEFAKAEVCGIVRVSDRKQMVILEDHQSEPSVVLYKVVNPDRFYWIEGSCTCVEGELLKLAQDNKEGWNYLLSVVHLDSIDETGRDCRPVFFP